MKKFLLIYLLALLFLFAIFYWDFSPIAKSINLWQVNLSSFLTSLTLPEEAMKENLIFINTQLTLVIDKACNGLIPYFFLLASIMAFPSTIKHKIKWAILSYLILSILNIFRIWFITKLVINSENNFSLAHDYLGNLFLVCSSMILFIAFIHTKKHS
ncbi:MAG: Unknown protein [uncultured Sulfurovum sp.]|uniref:Exosortase/archaeosortase family protein n=1 Tax=uncultured Sulfurovum sp. TaxID=269237 RepID=A0A6S6U682_9BACT|nr:MAG: Unknown protein [uncultured Sulfurovum sp.]